MQKEEYLGQVVSVERIIRETSLKTQEGTNSTGVGGRTF